MSAVAPTRQPRVTVAVIHHQLAGYAEDCLQSLGADKAGGETEFLLVHGKTGTNLTERLPQVREIRVVRGGRATAKNLAVKEARGEFLVLATADTLARPDAVEALRQFLASRDDDAVVSAQLLTENGRRRRADFPYPSLWCALDVIRWTRSRWSLLYRNRLMPLLGEAHRARSLHATFLMARRELFVQVGPFSEGYRFACEDLEWCHRARERGIGLFVLPRAHVFKLAPQRWGMLSPAVRLLMEQSFRRLVAETRSRGYAASYRLARSVNCLAAWALLAPANLLVGGSSPFIRNEEAVMRALLGLNRRTEPPDDDVESHVRWEVDY